MKSNGRLRTSLVLSFAALASLHAEDPIRVPDFKVSEPATPYPGLLDAVEAAGSEATRFDLNQLAANRPEIHFNSSSAGTFGAPVSYRGLSNSPYFGSSAVTFYVGDIPLSGPAATPALVPGLGDSRWMSAKSASFSVGRASSGGAVLLEFSPAPGGSAVVAAGSRNLRAGEVRQIQTQGTLELRAAAGLYQRDGYITNTTLGRTVGDADRLGANAELRWRPSPSTALRLLWVGSRARDGEQGLVPLYAPGTTVERSTLGRFAADFNGLALRGDSDTPVGRFTSITSRTSWNLRPYQNELVLPPQLNTTLTQAQSATNQEFRLRSDGRADFPWTAGAFVSRVDTEGAVQRDVFGLFPVEASTYTVRRSVAAAFGEAVLLNDAPWSLSASGRAERERQEFRRIETVPGSKDWTRETSATRLTPALHATYLSGEGSLVRLSWSETYKPGGFSAYTDRSDLAGFSSERNRAWDLEYKAAPTGKWPLAVRLFRYDLSRYQVERSFTATDYLVVNAPRALSEGVEVETSGRLHSHVHVRASAGWTRARLRSFTDPFSGQTFDRTPLPFTPAMKARAETLVTLLPGLELKAGVTWLGRTWFTEGRDSVYSENGYSLADVALLWTRGRFTAAFRCDNVFDRNYRTLVIPGIDHAAPGAPRSWSAELGYRW